MLRKVQWALFNRTVNSTRYFTGVHIYDTKSPMLPVGIKKTLCGKKFPVSDADYDEQARGRACRRCQKLTQERKDGIQ